MPVPDELPSTAAGDVTTRIDVAAQRPARVAAMRAHATQIAIWEHHDTVAYAMSNGVAQPLRDVEEFVLVGRPDAEETDLFAGVES